MNTSLLKRYGFDEKQIGQFCQLARQYKDTLLPLARDYLSRPEARLKDYRPQFEEMVSTTEEVFALKALFVALCSQEHYNALAEDQKDQFVTNMSSLCCKVNECISYKKVLGLFVYSWFDGFFKADKAKLGRLEFETVTRDTPLVVGSVTIEPGQPYLNVHIPSGYGPLTEEACMDAFKKAYQHFPHCIKEGLLYIHGYSWLFHPAYKEIFTPDTNIGRFVSWFKMYTVDTTESFDDCWRIFSMDTPEDLSELPRNTRLQKAFADHIAKGGPYGYGGGFMVFDGEQILPLV